MGALAPRGFRGGKVRLLEEKATEIGSEAIV